MDKVTGAKAGRALAHWFNAGDNIRHTLMQGASLMMMAGSTFSGDDARTGNGWSPISSRKPGASLKSCK
jgi:hypothetical protein